MHIHIRARSLARGRAMCVVAAIVLLTAAAALAPIAAATPTAALTPTAAAQTEEEVSSSTIETLPGPERVGGEGLFGLLQSRRSLRSFTDERLTPGEIGQLLWAGHGTTGTDRFTHHTIPSAGALYPIELFLLDSRGVARYHQADHALVWQTRDDQRSNLARACLQQMWAADAPAIIVVAGVPERTTTKYGDRGEHYVRIEAGCVLQNLLLTATELELGGTPIGAFRDEEVSGLLQLPPGWEPLLVVPVGHAAP